jgi:YHS domain-containing protein
MKALIAIAVVSMFGLAGVSHADDQTKPAPYPLATCFISGEKLGEMGKPVVFTYEGQELKMCCKDCKKKFDKDPAKYMKDFQSAVKKAGESGSSTMDPNMKM